MPKATWKTTAQGVALLRALATRERDPAVRNPDYMSPFLLTPLFRTLIKIRPVVWLGIKYSTGILPGGYYFHTARTKCIDNILQACINQGLQQLVILGAGFDTRSYRYQKSLQYAKVFELDFPGTQEIKKQRLAAANIVASANVTYIPIDFNNTGLEILLKKGYNPALKTLFIWEGVSMYLTPEAVDQVLSFIKHNSGPGSSIVFDYIFQSMVEGKCDYYGARESTNQVMKANEPYTFGIDEGNIKQYLEKRGYRFIEEFTPDRLEKMYMMRTDGRMHGKVYHYTNVVHAFSHA
jgi:methyltransferase (TIGR00027 family)